MHVAGRSWGAPEAKEAKEPLRCGRRLSSLAAWGFAARPLAAAPVRSSKTSTNRRFVRRCALLFPPTAPGKASSPQRTAPGKTIPSLLYYRLPVLCRLIAKPDDRSPTRVLRDTGRVDATRCLNFESHSDPVGQAATRSTHGS